MTISQHLSGDGHAARVSGWCSIFCFTGLRRGDAAVVGRQHVRDGVISIHTEKTGMLVTIPILTELQKTLDAGPTGDLTFIATVSGQPMTKVGLDNRFQEACDAAGVKKSAHGIRKAAATRAANNGRDHCADEFDFRMGR